MRLPILSRWLRDRGDNYLDARRCPPVPWLYAGRHFGFGVFDIFAKEEEAVRVGSKTITHFRGLRAAGLDAKVRQKHGYYFATASVADRYYRSSAGRVGRAGHECAVRDMLAVQEHGAEVEVSTPVGRIDLLLPSAVVEVKYASGWKDALGQVLSYSCYHPDKAKVIHLIGKVDHPDLSEHVRVCNTYGVVLRYQSLHNSMDGLKRLGPPLTANPSIERTVNRSPTWRAGLESSSESLFVVDQRGCG